MSVGEGGQVMSLEKLALVRIIKNYISGDCKPTLEDLDYAFPFIYPPFPTRAPSIHSVMERIMKNVEIGFVYHSQVKDITYGFHYSENEYRKIEPFRNKRVYQCFDCEKLCWCDEFLLDSGSYIVVMYAFEDDIKCFHCGKSAFNRKNIFHRLFRSMAENKT